MILHLFEIEIVPIREEGIVELMLWNVLYQGICDVQFERIFSPIRLAYYLKHKNSGPVTVMRWWPFYVSWRCGK